MPTIVGSPAEESDSTIREPSTNSIV